MASSKFAVGSEHNIPLADLVEPLIDRLVTITIEGEEFKARIIGAGSQSATVKVVPDSVRE